MSDEECSSSSSDSDSEGDDLIDLDQLKQQIEKEERELKELQTRTNGKASGSDKKVTKNRKRVAEKTNNGNVSYVSLMGTCSEINVSDRPRRKSTVLTSWSMRLVIRKQKLALHLIVPVHHKVFAKKRY